MAHDISHTKITRSGCLYSDGHDYTAYFDNVGKDKRWKLSFVFKFKRKEK
jgi:hypothetical protein